MADDLDVDVGPLTDDLVLERELRQALKSEGEIELFKAVNKRLRIGGELVNSEVLQGAVNAMWDQVGEFFDKLTVAPTIALLEPDHELVAAFHRMQANFEVIAGINATLKAGREAEEELQAIDDMTHDAEELT
jgi:hypothetical protein